MIEKKRQPRERRRPSVRVKLTPRDELVLQALARFRIARTGDLGRLAFPGIRRDTCAVRLRRLFDAGYLDVRAGDRATESVYSLGAKGRARFRAECGAGRIPRGGVEHHLGVVGTWVSIARAAHGIPGLRLEVLRSDWEIREHSAAVGPVVPDALVQFGVGDGGIFRVAVEVDLGTEPMGVLRRKVAAYQSLFGSEAGLFGWSTFDLAVALVGAGVSRWGAMERLLDTMWSGRWLLWKDDEGIMSALRSLVAVHHPLATSPYGKGRITSVTSCESE